MEDFLWRAALGGIGMALLAAPLGCFVVWRRMAYFGETIAHAGLLGVAFGVLLEINLTVGTFLMSLLVAFGLRLLDKHSRLAKDTALGLMAHVVLAVGLIVASQFQSLQLDLMGLLFGDILAISTFDLYLVFGGLLLVWGLVYFLWQDLLTLCLDRELALAEGVNVARVELLFSVAIALTIALAMKLVGLLLVTAMLIIPAAAAMNFSRSPEGMALITALLSGSAVILGILASLYVDIPTGPAIVVVMAVMFVISSVMKIR